MFNFVMSPQHIHISELTKLLDIVMCLQYIFNYICQNLLNCPNVAKNENVFEKAESSISQ